MIRADEAIRVGRSLIGTPYSDLDCINFIKRIIRTANGGVPRYQTATTVSLWASYDMSAKYRDLTWRQEGLQGAKAGMISFKGKPLGRDHQPSHVGLVTGRGTVLHSSSVHKGVVETPLTEKEGWTLLAKHRYISCEDEKEKPGMKDILYTAKVVTETGGLNLRKKPATDATRLSNIPKGASVYVIEELGDWLRVVYDGIDGYAKAEFLERVGGDEDEEFEPEDRNETTLMNEEGTCIVLKGRWRVAED